MFIFSGQTTQEIRKCTRSGEVPVKVSPDFCSPGEFDLLIDNSLSVEELLGWVAGTNLDQLCEMLVMADTETHKEDAIFR